METVQIEFQPRPREIVVMVGNHSTEISSALADVLEDGGYAVIEADNLREATAVIDAAATPMILVIGNAGMGTEDGVACFMALAAGSATRQAYIYVSSATPRGRLPALVYGLAQVGAPPPPRKSFELVSLLAMMGAAAARVCTG